MIDTAELVRQQRLIAQVSVPVEDHLFDWAIAVAKGGVKLLAIPVTLPNVTEVTSDLADEANLAVGVAGVVDVEQVSVALAAGAHFVLSPVCNTALVTTARGRGLTVIAGAATPTEVLRCMEAGADLVTLFPAKALGGPEYVRELVSQLPRLPIVASGGVDVDAAPSYLEAGAVAAIVDRGIFPEDADPAALEVITARAAAVAEVCSEVHGRRSDETLVSFRTQDPY
ncbi:MAG: bifunctional 4-hydroxy-2-oxoglutarate aldolase/2-dehydro-3-deoxy-phosphogluconate aldolase, partial [Polyangiales bacterium]